MKVGRLETPKTMPNVDSASPYKVLSTVSFRCAVKLISGSSIPCILCAENGFNCSRFHIGISGTEPYGRKTALGEWHGSSSTDAESLDLLLSWKAP